MTLSSIKRVGIVGLGSIGGRYLRLLKACYPYIEVILVRSGMGGCRSEQKLADETVSSLAQLISKNVDVAIVCGPASTHVSQTIELVRGCVPVLVEKPLSNSLFEVFDLMNLVERMNVTVGVGYVLRHTSDFKYFAMMLDSGVIGPFTNISIESSSYLPNWRPDRDYRDTVSAQRNLGGGVLLELSHELDYAMALFGPFVNVSARLSQNGSLEMDVEDTADLKLETRVGLPILVHLEFYRDINTRRCVVHGQYGCLVWDIIAKTVSLERNGKVSEVSNFSADVDFMFKEQISDFFYAVENSVEPKVRLVDGAAVLEVVDAARRSSDEGRVIKIQRNVWNSN